MCGIAGVLQRSGAPVPPERLAGMADCLRHRGPDAQGLWTDDARGPGNWSVGLAHRRLSIIDLAGGAQPMANESGSICLVLNGEIYNYVELRAALLARGVRFRTESDTEVLLRQYEIEGIDCLKRLRGMFAFAIWDAGRQRLFLARDRAGKKPLWWAEQGNRLLFASELQGLLADPDWDRSIDRTALDRYLVYGYIPSPASIFERVRKIPPAHAMTVDRNGTRLFRYWQAPMGPKWTFSETEGVERFRTLFEEAVRIRLRSDVPLGAFLSGGLDSASVVAVMARLSSRPVRTFTIGFEESDYSEAAAARITARRWGTEHREFLVRPNAAEILPDLIRHYGEPYADSSALPTYYVARETRQHVTVALCGDGGDELLGGYPRYWGGAVSVRLDRLPVACKRWAGRLAGRLERRQIQTAVVHPLHRLGRFLRAFSDQADLPERYLRWVGFFMPEELAGLYDPAGWGAPGEAAPQDFLFDLIRTSDAESVEEKLMQTDFRSYLPEDLLVKVDIASMAHGLEVRSPFLDQELVAFTNRCPSHWKIRGGQTKRLLRRAMGEALPEAIRRRPKMGFGIPLGQWLRGELREWMRGILLDPSARRRRWFRIETVERLIREHTEGIRDHRYRLWNLTMLELWASTVLEETPAGAAVSR